MSDSEFQKQAQQHIYDPLHLAHQSISRMAQEIANKDYKIARLKKILEMKDSLDEFRTLEKNNEALTERVKRLEFSLSDEISLSSAVIKERNVLLERVNELEARCEDCVHHCGICDDRLTEAQGRIERAIKKINEYPRLYGELFNVKQILKGDGGG